MERMRSGGSGPARSMRVGRRGSERNGHGKAMGLERDYGDVVGRYIYKKCDTPISLSDPQASRNTEW
ncbi:MAG: hypothetical protein PHT14_11520, partial [Petrimonas sp.]|nr:hypothetical protein [Petrimonas sp.]